MICRICGLTSHKTKQAAHTVCYNALQYSIMNKDFYKIVKYGSILKVYDMMTSKKLYLGETWAETCVHTLYIITSIF